MLKLLVSATLMLGLIVHIITKTSALFIERGGDLTFLNGFAFMVVVAANIAYVVILVFFYVNDRTRILSKRGY